MNEQLVNGYFEKALATAKQGKLTKAIEYLGISLGLNPDHEPSKKLAGLCYYKLGNYGMVDNCFENSLYYQSKIKINMQKKQKELREVRKQIEQKRYKEAIKLLEKMEEKNVKEHNLHGCLYGTLGKKRKAIQCFFKALSLDSENKEALLYLKESQNIKKKWW